MSSPPCLIAHHLIASHRLHHYPMLYSEARTCLETTSELLYGGGDESLYAPTLLLLGIVVRDVVVDVSLRDALVQAGTIEYMLTAITNMFSLDKWSSIEPILLFHMRLFRGALLLIRNLIPFADRAVSGYLMVDNVKMFLIKADHTHSLYEPCIQALLEVLANNASKFGPDFLIDVDTFAVDVIAPITPLLTHPAISQPLTMIICASLATDIAITALLRPAECPAVTDFVAQNLTDHPELLALVEQMVCHEKFHNWIIYNLKSNSADFLRAAVLAITHKEDWSNTQYVTILDWTLDVVKKYSPLAISALKSESCNLAQLDSLHLILVRALDIVADLGKFNHTQHMLLQREALDTIIPLFRAIHENTSVKKAKIEDPTKKQFPEVSSLIIEILANTCHTSFEAQEKIRELHGLELVLSSCVIDDNNPFMKERAILCLRFLLEKNQKNQQFVANLEAKNVADSTALEEAGYEVNFVDGRVQVKKKHEEE